MLVTFAFAVPLPFATGQVCSSGCVATGTAEREPAATVPANVHGPLALTVSCAPPVFCRVTLPTRPLIDPPTVNVGGGGGPPPPPPPPQAASVHAVSTTTMPCFENP